MTLGPQAAVRATTWLSAHKRFTMATDIQVFFCDPQSPWQRGSNENTNGATGAVPRQRAGYRAIDHGSRPFHLFTGDKKHCASVHRMDDAGMIPQLHISKVQSSVYEARLLEGNEEIFESTLHESIGAAIKEVADDFPDELSHFLEVRYVDVSIGTQSLAKLRAEPQVFAACLVDLTAAVRHAEEHPAVV